MKIADIKKNGSFFHIIFVAVIYALYFYYPPYQEPHILKWGSILLGILYSFAGAGVLYSSIRVTSPEEPKYKKSLLFFVIAALYLLAETIGNAG